MTLVNVNALVSALGGPDPAGGTVTATYWAGWKAAVLVDGDEIIFPKPMTTAIVSGQPVEPLELDPTLGFACVKWEFRITGAKPYVVYTTIPALPTVDFGELPLVDHMTFEPNEVDLAAWQAAINDLNAAGAVIIADAEDARDAAGDYAEDAQAYMASAWSARNEAAAARDAAAGSATSAATARTGAETAQTAAEAARTGAEAARTGAETARTGAETAQTGAQTAKADAETAANVSLTGQFNGTIIPNTGADLNTMVTPGVFRFPSSTLSASTGLPVQQAGVLEVVAVNGVTHQTYKTVSIVGVLSYSRSGSSGSMRPWRLIATQRINSPAGQPGVEVFTWDDANAREQQMLPVGTGLGTVDLNSVFAVGQYGQNNGSNATLARNYPVAGGAGTLEVLPMAGGGSPQQRWVPFPSVGTSPTQRTVGHWTRGYRGGAWQAWCFTPAQRINSPTDQPGVEVLTWDDANSREQVLMPATIELGAFDLNSVTLPGFYGQSVQANATLAKNYPRANVLGTLEVVPAQYFAGRYVNLIQRFTPQSGSGFAGAKGFWQRRYHSGTTWTPWEFFATQRVDQTAGRAIYTWDDLNNREQLVYGDTGWRNLSAELINGWSGGTGSLYVRRYGSMVFMRIVGIGPANATNDAFLNSISGFRHSGLQGWEAIATGLSSTQALLMREQGGTLSIVRQNPPSGIFASLSWPTDDPWPTSLPGTASGSIISS